MTDTTPEVIPQETVTTPDWERYIEIDGKKLSEEEVKKWWLRQEDYTRKTQELAKREKELEAIQQNKQWGEENPEEVLIDFIKASKERLWFVSLDEIKTIQQQVEQEKQLDSLMQSNPELKKFEKAIRAYQKVEWCSYEEALLGWGFLSTDKLEKAKARSIVGNRDEKTEKAISDMTTAEWDAFKAKQGIKGGSSFVKKQVL